MLSILGLEKSPVSKIQMSQNANVAERIIIVGDTVLLLFCSSVLFLVIVQFDQFDCSMFVFLLKRKLWVKTALCSVCKIDVPGYAI